MKDLTKITSLFTTKIVKNRTHVLCEPQNSRYKVYPEADYLGTGMALIGILNPGQTLDEFKQDWIERYSK